MAVVAIVIVLALDIVIMILMNPEPRLPWTGEWDAAWGYHDESITDLDTLLNMIEDDEGNVTGTYSYNSIEGTIEGVADGGKLHGTWAQGHLSVSYPPCWGAKNAPEARRGGTQGVIEAFVFLDHASTPEGIATIPPC